jgi:hypothetical protein
MPTSAVDRATTTTTTSITSRTGLERPRLQAWPGTAKEKGTHDHHGHGANLRSSPLGHGEGAVFFLRCGNELREITHPFISALFLLCLWRFCAEGEASMLLACCGVAGRKIDVASNKKYPCFLLPASFALCDFRPTCAITIFVSRSPVHRHDHQCRGRSHRMDPKRSLKSTVIYWTATTAPYRSDQALVTLLTKFPSEPFKLELPAERLCDKHTFIESKDCSTTPLLLRLR